MSVVINWLDTRLDLSGLRHFMAEKGVPVHAQKIWYYLGGMTLFLFMVQVASGILLLLYYRPSATEAYESVQFIVTQVEFGWLIRNIHSWSANLLIASAFAHLFSVFFLKAYRKPRELTWVGGVLLLFLMMGFGFSGYLLPWNELSFFATKVGTGIAGTVPFVGRALLRFLRGGDDVTGATLSRFYALHVAILPALSTVLVTLHLLFVQRQGMSVPTRTARRLAPGERIKQMPFFPDYILRDVLVCIALAIWPRRRSTRGAWSESGSVRACSGGDPPRMVFPGDVSHAETAAQSCPGHRRGTAGRAGLRPGGARPSGGAVSRSPRRKRGAEPDVHRDRPAGARLLDCVHDHRIQGCLT